MAYRRRRFKWQGFKRAFSRGGAKAMYRGGGGSLLFGIGGAVAGYAAPRVIPYQDTAMMAIAALPGALPMGRTIPWQLRRFASGYVIGQIIKAFVPGIAGMGTSRDINADFA